MRLPGFGNGYVQWDDEDDDNKNNITGQLPDGDYDRNTRIYFCCRDDGYATNVINLPTDKPFVLLKSDSHLRQIVNGTKMREEYFRWDNEDDSGYITDLEDKHAYLEHSLNNLKPTTVITINSHTNVKFSRLHYLLQSILRYYCTGNL